MSRYDYYGEREVISAPDFDPEMELDFDDDIAQAEDAEYAADLDETARQARIAAGIEQACASCGCSESRPCSGGCIWATRNICSRCVR